MVKESSYLINKLTVVIILSVIICNIKAQPLNNKKLTRDESFFGLHYDLHAKINLEHAGKTLTEEMVEELIRRVKPDYLQVDTKGHKGVTSYPGKYGPTMKSFDKDPLRLFREVTERNNVALYSHYSGVVDEYEVTQHPDWAAVNYNGEPHRRSTSYFSPYFERKMGPQLRELALEYRIDGVWVDGDCWGMEVDFGSACKEAFTKETGLIAPNSPSDNNYNEFIEFNRTLFKRHVNRYTTAIKDIAPDFEVASNWAYSSKMPEPVELPVDFLSGDVAAKNTVYSAAFEARCLAPQGMPWDLMAWSFTQGEENDMNQWCQKSTVHLQQEAAQVIAMGGGLQVYFRQNRDLSIQPYTVDLASEIAQFCRERQEFCHKAEPITQIAMLYSTTGFKDRANKKGLVNKNGQWCDDCGEFGISELLLDAALPFEIKSEHHLTGKLAEYPVVIIPEWHYLSPGFFKELKQYAENGGNLLVIGAHAVQLFEDVLGVEFVGDIRSQASQFIGISSLTNIQGDYQSFNPKHGTKVLSKTYSTNDFRKPMGNAVTVSNFGKGKIAGIFIDLGAFYRIGSSPVFIELLDEIMDELFQNPLVSIESDVPVNITLMQKNGKAYINLINAGGNHRDAMMCTYGFLPPLHNVEVQTQFYKEIKLATLQPAGINLKVEQGRIIVPAVNVH